MDQSTRRLFDPWTNPPEGFLIRCKFRPNPKRPQPEFRPKSKFPGDKVENFPQSIHRSVLIPRLGEFFRRGGEISPAGGPFGSRLGPAIRNANSGPEAASIYWPRRSGTLPLRHLDQRVGPRPGRSRPGAGPNPSGALQIHELDISREAG